MNMHSTLTMCPFMQDKSNIAVFLVSDTITVYDTLLWRSKHQTTT